MIATRVYNASLQILWASGALQVGHRCFNGQLAHRRYMGGAYSHPQGDGKAAKQLATRFCDALFEQRFSEVHFFGNYDAWTPWFHEIAWDWTAVLFDLRKRLIWILAVTDRD